MDSRRVGFPIELISEVVAIAADDDRRILRGKRDSLQWLKQTATVSKEWGTASQRMLFSSLWIGSSTYSGCARITESQRIDFLESYPRLAAYVAYLNLWRLNNDFGSVLPEMTRRLASVLHNVKTIHIHPLLLDRRPQSQTLNDTLCSFTFVKHLRVTTFALVHSFAHNLVDLSLFSLHLSGTNSGLSADIATALCNTGTKHTLQKLDLTWGQWDGPSFQLLQTLLPRFSNLHELRLRFHYRCTFEKVIDDDISLRHLARVQSIRVILRAVTDDSVRFIRALFASASLPALVHLELGLQAGHHREGIDFTPFSPDHLQAQTRILPDTIVESLDVLRITFVEGVEIREGDRFFELLGVQHRPGVLQFGAEPWVTMSEE